MLRYPGVGRRKIYRSDAEKQAAYRERKRRRQPVQFWHRSDEWETPQEIFHPLHAEFAFTLDVAAFPHNAKCERFFSPAQDGLKQQWQGVCWMNPPYGLAPREWIRKAHESALAGATVVCLVPARTDARWWHDYVIPHAEIRFIRGRIRFGNSPNSAPFPSAVVVFRPNAGNAMSFFA